MVPRFEAKITRNQYSGSDESEDMIPYSGTCEQTKKMRSVTAVHSIFWLKGTYARCYLEQRGYGMTDDQLCVPGTILQGESEGMAEQGSKTGLYIVNTGCRCSKEARTTRHFVGRR